MIKGAIRRAFSRSEYRRKALQAAKVDHSDPRRPRVKIWYQCAHCKGYFAQHELEVDHKDPVVPVTQSLELMSWDDVVNRTWCEVEGLQVLCAEGCHRAKTLAEQKQRREVKKALQKKPKLVA